MLNSIKYPKMRTASCHIGIVFVLLLCCSCTGPKVKWEPKYKHQTFSPRSEPAQLTGHRTDSEDMNRDGYAEIGYMTVSHCYETTGLYKSPSSYMSPIDTSDLLLKEAAKVGGDYVHMDSYRRYHEKDYYVSHYTREAHYEESDGTVFRKDEKLANMQLKKHEEEMEKYRKEYREWWELRRNNRIKGLFSDLKKAIEKKDQAQFKRQWDAAGYKKNLVGGSGWSGDELFKQTTKESRYLWPGKISPVIAEASRSARNATPMTYQDPACVVQTKVRSFKDDKILDEVFTAVVPRGERFVVLGVGKKMEEVKALVDR